MHKKAFKIIGLALCLTSLSSCAWIFNAAVSPDRCKKCEVINLEDNSSLWEEEGCGGNTANLEERVKAKAYDLSREGRDICTVKVQCKVWKQNE